MTERAETFISVDVETAGPNPADYSLLSIGACLVDDPDTGFYVELKPVTAASRAEALAVSGLSLDRLAAEGVEPVEAMASFEEWITEVTPPGSVPVMVAFNAVFDWMFVDMYFQRFVGRNPFGHSALDVKAYYLGMMGGTWAGTSMRFLSPLYLQGRHLSHNALGDARDQAELFGRLRAERGAPD
ncbi:exonuclease domain-containing protein [Microbacterium sp. BWT-B31]|uniref:3'-5' exonuclease n=1 Tax=Microbacterium sp. BWT-B31 TaxID=3232072 RepID=UPI003529074F